MKKQVIVVGLFYMLVTLLSCTEQSKQTTQEKSPAKQTEETKQSIKFQNKGHELVYKAVQKTGDYQKLLDQKDVVYNYTYRTPDGKEDVSTEKYIFNGELSVGQYTKHERNMPKLEGPITQGFDGKNFWLTHNGSNITDPEILKGAIFTRRTNFYWFAMMQKLLDPGLLYKHLRQEKLNDITYDVVEVTFDESNKKGSDTYHLYINSKTSLIDQFLFTVVDFKVVDKPLLMRVTYETFNGLMIPSYRKYTRSNWKGEVLKDDAWVEEISKDIKFNQDLKVSEFKAPATPSK